MTVDQAIVRVRERAGQLMDDQRRQFLTETALDGECDPDAVDAAVAAYEEDFRTWLDALLTNVRAELVQASREQW